LKIYDSTKNLPLFPLIIRDNNIFKYFDSYGTSPKNILDYIPKYMNGKLGYDYGEDFGKMIRSIKPTDQISERTRRNNYMREMGYCSSQFIFI